MTKNNNCGKNIHIIGIGNITRFDDGIAIKIIEELEKEYFPSNIKITDLGTGGLDLIFALDGWIKAIIIDAVDIEGLMPGEIVEYQIIDDLLPDIQGLSSTHGFDALTALKMAYTLEDYNLPSEIIIIGIQIKQMNGIGTTISTEVEEAIPLVIDKIKKIIEIE